jgi:K+-sensing histidine kinase KdpD
MLALIAGIVVLALIVRARSWQWVEDNSALVMITLCAIVVVVALTTGEWPGFSSGEEYR